MMELLITMIKLGNKYKIDTTEYGLFKLLEQEEELNECFPNENTIAECKLTTNQLEFKMKDFELTILVSATQQTITLFINPQLTTEQVVKELIQMAVVPSGNYNLKVDLNGTLQRLDYAKPLITIEELQDKNVCSYIIIVTVVIHRIST